MDASPDLDDGAPRLSTTVVMAIAAGAAALIAIFGSNEPTTWITPVFAMVGLVPWALEAAGIRLHPGVFVVMTILPAAVVVLIDRNAGGLFPVLIAVVWITHRRTSTATTVIALISAVGMTVGLAVVSSTDNGIIYFIGGIGVAWLTGNMLHRQEQLVTELYEATQRERAHAAVEERTRIAREVHDVIAHSLTVTILHVAGARRALTNDPQRAAEALERAEDVGRESLDSIRQVVGLLRDADPGSDEASRLDDMTLPQVSDLTALIDQYRDAGLQIDASVRLDGICRPGALTSLTLFRLVQEAMTNALQHAPGAPVSLDVHTDDDRSSVHVTVENPTPALTPRRPRTRHGLGLTGMTERVRSTGGSIDIGPTDRGTWLISAEVPLIRATEPL